jgi:D-beta-D-heptose 7-phosphate kinase/D-beta-D-heptose 1-phosphate adenosyltransferase
VQVVQVQRETYSLGGAGNVVANLRSLGAQVQLLALVGTDVNNTPIERLLSEQAVSPAGLIADASRPTTIKTRVLAAHHQLLRFDVERVAPCSNAAAAAILQALSQQAQAVDVVVLSDYGKGVLTPQLVRELIALCKRENLRVLVDPKGDDYTHYRGATLLTPNRKEAAAATGLALAGPNGADATTQAGARLLRELDLEACLITLSEDGMALFERDSAPHRLPTQAREVFDVTGAGDTVIAAIAFALACGQSMLEACEFANRAAGVVVGKLGAATVTLDELTSTRASQRPTTSSTHGHGRALEPEAKILSQAALHAEIMRLRAAGQRIVFTNGCFDILHAGHIQYLNQAARLGDALVVGLNSDASVKRLKGPTRPLNSERDRAFLLAALSAVGYVAIFDQDTPLELITQLVPDVLVKGGDWRAEDIVGGSVVRAAGGRVAVLPFVDGHSTTGLIERAQHTQTKQVSS